MSHALSFEIAGSGGIIGGAGGGGGGPAGPSFGALVDGGGGADYTTIQDAINDNLKMFYVKGGQTYTENLTLDETCQRLILGPGTVISGTIDFSSGIENVIIKGGPGCQITGDITFGGSNTGCAITGENGFAIDSNIDGVIVDSSTSLFIDLGGYDSLVSDNFAMNSDDMVAQNYSVNTKSGAAGDTADDGVTMFDSCGRSIVRNVVIIDSSGEGIERGISSVDCILVDNLILDADLRGIEGQGPRTIISNNNISAVGSAGIDSDGNGDDSIWANNIVDDSVTNAAGDNDQLIYGNRIDTTLTDNDGTGTFAANDINAF